MRETVEVDRDYLWALEVLACHSLGIDIEPEELSQFNKDEAVTVVERANLTQPRPRNND